MTATLQSLQRKPPSSNRGSGGYGGGSLAGRGYGATTGYGGGGSLARRGYGAAPGNAVTGRGYGRGSGRRRSDIGQRRIDNVSFVCHVTSYKVFIKYCVFSLKFCDFSEFCRFCCRADVLPA